jgi:DNA-binding MarR family transcriptional regulator
MQRGLGTQLRHLIELLDGTVAEQYRRENLNYRPRYTPVMRALMACSPLSVTEIAEIAGITQPAATQTIALMIREGLLVSESSREDSRQKVIEMTRHGRDLLPRLQTCWEAVTTAANSLDADLPFPLSQLLDLAIEALAKKPFETRIQAARQTRRIPKKEKCRSPNVGAPHHGS